MSFMMFQFIFSFYLDKKPKMWSTQVAYLVNWLPLAQVMIPPEIKPHIGLPAQWEACFSLRSSSCLYSLTGTLSQNHFLKNHTT